MPYSADSFTAGEVPTTAKWNKLWDNDADFDSRISAAAPVGEIAGYGGSSAPTGWLLCDGSAVSRTTYAALFAIYGVVYGAGNGSTTFNLPNLKGKVPVGRDSGQTEFDVVGETGGAKTHTLITSEIPSHSHIHGTRASNRTVPVASGGVEVIFIFGAGTDPTETTGGGGAHNNLQPYQVINYICKT